MGVSAMTRLAWASALLIGIFAASEARAAEIAISCGAVGQELRMCRTAAEAWAKKTGHTVEIISTPNESNQRLALYQQLLAAGSPDIDVFQIDVIWPGILGRHFVDLSGRVPPEIFDAHFATIVKNNTVGGRIVAMPWFIDAGLLYYRKDLLEKYGEAVPNTWGEMTRTAKRIQDAERAAGNDKMWGFVFQGRAYEGLTCDALEWVHSYGGGTIVELDGSISVHNPKAVAAIQRAASWIGTITPKGVLNYAEEEARGVFQSGNAVFMRNWPYAWSLGNAPESPVAGKIGTSALPKGPNGEHRGTLGGWQLAVSKYSKNPKIAVDLILYLTSSQEQRRRAIEASFNPTRKALYKDPEVIKANPFFLTLREVFTNAVPRPSRITGVRYNRVSTAFWNAVHAALSGEADAESALKTLSRRLARIRRGKKW